MQERAPRPPARSKPGRQLPGSRIALLWGALGLASACLNPAISDEAPISEAVTVLDADEADADAGVEAVDEPSEAVDEPNEAVDEPSEAPSRMPPERSRGETRTRGTRRR